MKGGPQAPFHRRSQAPFHQGATGPFPPGATGPFPPEVTGPFPPEVTDPFPPGATGPFHRGPQALSTGGQRPLPPGATGPFPLAFVARFKKRPREEPPCVANPLQRQILRPSRAVSGRRERKGEGQTRHAPGAKHRTCLKIDFEAKDSRTGGRQGGKGKSPGGAARLR
jgi:hypothetical protein